MIDEPTRYRELTLTAMSVAAMARGVRLGWLERNEVGAALARGERAVYARVNPEATLKDVCAGTAVGATKEYYLNRSVVNGADDRGGAMALLAVVEMDHLRRVSASQPPRALQTLLDAALEGFPGRAGVWVKHLTTAHKTGDFPPVLANDVGIVFARSGPIVVSFFANAIEGNYGEAEDRIGQLARRVVEYFDR